MRYSKSPVTCRAHTKPSPVSRSIREAIRSEARVTSNVGQSYPYSSETEAQRAGAVAAYVAGHEGSADTLKAETTPLDANDRWWIWKCPTAGCPGFLHAAGYAHDRHALYVVCDGTCGKTFLR